MSLKPILNICRCHPPKKIYSKAGCYSCWTCEICGNFGGCDNKYWDCAIPEDFIDNNPGDISFLPETTIMTPKFMSYQVLPTD